MTSTLSVPQMLEAIVRHSEHLAVVATGRFADPVPGCPGWTVADLVDHVSGVQWSWGTRVLRRSTSGQLDDDGRPATGLPEAQALSLLRDVTRRLVQALDGDEAHQRVPVWTWAPADQTVGFVTRHQVQEAAVHDADACRASGVVWTVDPSVAADCVAEFLSHSIATVVDPADPGTARLGEPLVLTASDSGDRWRVADGEAPGTLVVDQHAPAGGAIVSATAGELLLWLYQRIELDGFPDSLVGRFRALTWTS